MEKVKRVFLTVTLWVSFVFPHSILKDFNAVKCGGGVRGVVGEEMGGGIWCGCGREPQPSSKSAELRVHKWKVNYAPHPNNIYWCVPLYLFGTKSVILQPALVYRETYTFSSSLSGRICHYLGGAGGYALPCWMFYSSSSSSSSQRPPSSSAPWTSLTSPSPFIIWMYVFEHRTCNDVSTWSAVV